MLQLQTYDVMQFDYQHTIKLIGHDRWQLIRNQIVNLINGHMGKLDKVKSQSDSQKTICLKAWIQIRYRIFEKLLKMFNN